MESIFFFFFFCAFSDTEPEVSVLFVIDGTHLFAFGFLTLHGSFFLLCSCCSLCFNHFRYCRLLFYRQPSIEILLGSQTRNIRFQRQHLSSQLLILAEFVIPPFTETIILLCLLILDLYLSYLVLMYYLVCQHVFSHPLNVSSFIVADQTSFLSVQTPIPCILNIIFNFYSSVTAQFLYLPF